LISDNFFTTVIKIIKQCDDISLVNDFTDSLLDHRLLSKKWLVDNIPFMAKNILVLGAWYQTYIPYRFGKDAKFTLVDINPNIIDLNKKFFINYFGHDQNLNICIKDARSFLLMNQVHYDLVINTSCEHMHYDMKNIIKDKKSLYAFQSNNYTEHPSHINCKNSINDFIVSTGLTKIFYSGVLPMTKYDRYLVIGEL